jgi:hypothetical protein
VALTLIACLGRHSLQPLVGLSDSVVTLSIYCYLRQSQAYSVPVSPLLGWWFREPEPSTRHIGMRLDFQQVAHIVEVLLADTVRGLLVRRPVRYLPRPAPAQ